MIPNPKHEHPAEVIRWIDADTVILRVHLDYLFHGDPIRHRMLWLDAPERYTDGGKAATAEVNRLAPVGSKVLVRSFKEAGHPDSLYRWLAELWCPSLDISINEHLLKEGYADPFMQGPITVGQSPQGRAWVDMTRAAADFGRAYAEFQNSIDRYVATDPYGRSADG